MKKWRIYLSLWKEMMQVIVKSICSMDSYKVCVKHDWTNENENIHLMMPFEYTMIFISSLLYNISWSILCWIRFEHIFTSIFGYIIYLSYVSSFLNVNSYKLNRKHEWFFNHISTHVDVTIMLLYMNITRFKWRHYFMCTYFIMFL